MYNIERKALIVDLLEKNNTVSVIQLAQMLNISKETVRRDLRELEQEGLIKRTHGGAILEVPSNSSEYPFNVREIQRFAEKAIICKRAAQFIEDGDTIFVDNSSTTMNLLKHINPHYQVTVITNSIRLLIESTTINNPHLTLISLGGIFRAKNYSLAGVMSIDWARNFRPNKAFISCRSVRPDTGLSDGSIYEVDTKRALIQTAQEVYLLADHSKFKDTGTVHLADVSSVQWIITDKGADKESLRQLEMKGIKIAIAD